MAMWRCPHCGTPQPEAARCWVCRRSSTICSTCRHFRRSLAASVGYCGLDRRRAPLTGLEHRGCWDAAPVGVAAPVAVAAPPAVAAPVGVAAGTPVASAMTPVAPAVARLRPGPPSGSRPGILEGFVPVELGRRDPRTLEPVDRPVDRSFDRSLDRSAASPPVTEVVDLWADRATLFGDREI